MGRTIRRLFFKIIRSSDSFCKSSFSSKTPQRTQKLSRVPPSAFPMTYLGTQAPPAMVFLHLLQCHIPTHFLFIVFWRKRVAWCALIRNKRITLPQKQQAYFACCDISIFLTIFLREAPYLVPYFPTTPAFFVRLACAQTKKGRQKGEILLLKNGQSTFLEGSRKIQCTLTIASSSNSMARGEKGVAYVLCCCGRGPGQSSPSWRKMGFSLVFFVSVLAAVLSAVIIQQLWELKREREYSDLT